MHIQPSLPHSNSCCVYRTGLVEEICSGIRAYFCSMLGSQLLYKFERLQYAEVSNGEFFLISPRLIWHGTATMSVTQVCLMDSVLYVLYVVCHHLLSEWDHSKERPSIDFSLSYCIYVQYVTLILIDLAGIALQEYIQACYYSISSILSLVLPLPSVPSTPTHS